MKKRYLSLVIVSTLLAGCSSKLPDELYTYLKNCNVTDAYDWVENIELIYTSVSKELLSDKILGEQKVYYLQDKKDADDLYAYYDGIFSGTFITDKYPETATEPNLTSLRHIRQTQDSKYVAARVVNGTPVPDLVMTYDEMYGSLLSFFYNSVQSNHYIGGMYYADMFYLSSNQYRNMSLDENNYFIYKLVDEGSLDKDDNVISRVNETIKMNDKGMLETLDISVHNYSVDPYIVIETHMTITYNNDEFARIIDLNASHPYF